MALDETIQLDEQDLMDYPEVWVKSANKFGDIVGYFVENSVIYFMVEFDDFDLHLKPTDGERFSQTEVPIWDIYRIPRTIH